MITLTETDFDEIKHLATQALINDDYSVIGATIYALKCYLNGLGVETNFDVEAPHERT